MNIGGSFEAAMKQLWSSYGATYGARRSREKQGGARKNKEEQGRTRRS